MIKGQNLNNLNISTSYKWVDLGVFFVGGGTIILADNQKKGVFI